MTVTRGLIIADPWIDHILNGRKDWEMRSQATSIRGWFGLIRKGSGSVVGLARLRDCGMALNQTEMIANFDHHRIPVDMIRRGEVAKWVVPWKLADVIPLARSVPYEHKAGAVTWVTLSPDVSQKLAPYIARHDQADIDRPPPSRSVDHYKPLSTALYPATKPIRPNAAESRKASPLPEGKHRILGQSVLSGGNIRNNHIKLSAFIHAFPREVIGGSNKAEAASRHLEIDWGGPESAKTDIDRTKSIFRARGWVRRFFATSEAKEGDIVVFTETAPYRISVRLERGKPPSRTP
ncbi:hypothetical protein A3753_04200 [Sulfitobacter sp. HI0082]|nr:hypothetical protein A3753_04200 [Sulfitobacter sp. HI0082]|tara:strand:- start:4805 stop:5683 length:879 start_codon:yes stop_codon:yes gene_type:complete